MRLERAFGSLGQGDVRERPPSATHHPQELEERRAERCVHRARHMVRPTDARTANGRFDVRAPNAKNAPRQKSDQPT
jgi:hypothetical protein